MYCSINSCFKPWTVSQLAEATTWFNIAVPMAVALVARLGIETTDTAFLGHLGVSELASAALALVWVDFTSASLWQSYGATIKALCAQAVGAGNWELAGAWLWIAMLSCSAAIVPVSVAWLYTEDVLLGVGYAHEESSKAGEFTRWYILSLPPMMWYICVQNYLQGRGDAIPALIINLSLVAVNAGLNYILIFGSPSLRLPGLGFVGSPIATSVTRWISFVLVLAYVAWKGGKDRAAVFCGLSGPDVWSADRWHELHAKRLLPLMAGNLLENAQLQLVSFLGAELGPHALAAHQVMLQVFFFLTSGLYGLVSATTVRVGHNLGAGQVGLARFVAWLDLVVSGGIGLLISGVLLGAGRHLGVVFTQDEAVLGYIGQLSRLVGPAYFLMAVFFVSVAVLQGQARSLAIMASFLPGAWGVSVPLAFVFVLVLHLGLQALWGALVAGYATVTLTAAYFVMTSDWEELSKAAVKRSSTRFGPETVAGGGSPRDASDSGGAMAVPLLDERRTEGEMDEAVLEEGGAVGAPAAVDPSGIAGVWGLSTGQVPAGASPAEGAAGAVEEKEPAGSLGSIQSAGLAVG